MNAPTISSNTTKRHSQSSSGNLFKSSAPLQVSWESSEKFTCTLVHEIRNPLTNIDLAVEMLKQMVGDEDQKMYLDIIMRSSGRIKNMVTDLLISREANEMKPRKHSVHHLLEEVLTMNEDRLMLKNITLRKNYTAQDSKILFNRPDMKIALTNIIINAIEAMPAKNGLLEITTRRLDGACIIIIKDNGTGISKENLKTIFTPYFTNKPGGLGLGLSGALDILGSNHVWVNVRSELGRGTRFSLSFKKESA